MMINLHKVLVTLLLSCFTYAQDNSPEFKPHMLIHMNKGCPQNSSCTKVMGEVYSQFYKTVELKIPSKTKAFIKTHGAPLSLWTKQREGIDTITFDSRCKNHRQKDNLIYEGIRFVKKPNSLLDNPTDYPSFTIRQRDYKVYVIPRKSLPITYSNKGLYYLQDSNGLYFHYLVSQNSISVDYNIKTVKEILGTKCPEKLMAKFRENVNNPSLYQGVYCKKIWNISTKKYETFAFGWSC